VENTDLDHYPEDFRMKQAEIAHFPKIAHVPITPTVPPLLKK
jgi:hypothetical protein